VSEIANKSNEQKVADVEDEMPACMMIEDMLADLGCESSTLPCWM
jgi:hypothetical protein